MKIKISGNRAENFFRAIRSKIDDRLPISVKYLDLGLETVRVLCYTETIVPILEKQFSYVLRDYSEGFDATIAVFDEADVDEFTWTVYNCLDPALKRKLKAEMLWLREKSPRLDISSDDADSFFSVKKSEGYIEVSDFNHRTVYCAYDSYEPEKFVKYGHAFVRTISKLIKNATSNLVHGAVFGYEGSGFLLCGRGKRGKSTLTVESMLSGFEFVSDDYQILNKSGDRLLAYPIYSIITLSYRMYNEMYGSFRGKFVSNNFSQDKYIFNISCYHDQFRTAYPVKFCLFPEIVADEQPSIRKCSASEKGRAIVQLIHSTLSQMEELDEPETVEKIFKMVKELPFYRFNLSDNIRKNTEYLREFLSAHTEAAQAEPFDEQLIFDITYGLATVLDLQNYVFYDMNKFASNLFSLLLSGSNHTIIRNQLEAFTGKNPDILKEYDSFVRFMEKTGLDQLDVSDYPCPDFSPGYAEKSDYHLSVRTYGAPAARNEWDRQ